MLDLAGVSAGYGQGDVIADIGLTVRPGEVLSLLGRNGAGKSTTMRAVMGLIDARGSIRFRGTELLGLSAHRIARLGIGYVPEERRIFPRLTVEENLEVTRPMADGGTRWSLADVYDAFPVLYEYRRRPGGRLSGGEQQMLAIARALMGGPLVLLLDEPSEGLAPLIVQELARRIGVLKERGLAILLSEQNLAFARTLSDRVAILDRGRIRFMGSFADLDGNDASARSALFVSAAGSTLEERF